MYLSTQQIRDKLEREERVKRLVDTVYANWPMFELLERLAYYETHSKAAMDPITLKGYSFHIDAIKRVVALLEINIQ